MFTPENDLERALVRAADDPAQRPQFYRVFVSSDIFVVRHGPPPETAGRVVLEEGTQLQIQPVEIGGKTYLPVFSSVARIQSVISEEVGYVGMNALEFLQITRGAELFLNPGSGYGKEFTRAEIESIIDGSIWQPSVAYEVEKPTDVMIGQPSRYPHQLTEALGRLFAGLKEVKSAYVAHFFNPERDEKSHTLVGISVSGGWEDVVAQAGLVAREVEVPDPPVDFMRIDGGGGVADYFLKECKPFYKKKRFGLF